MESKKTNILDILFFSLIFLLFAGIAAAGRYQFTLPAYLTNPAQPLPYEPHKPRRPATDDRNAVASARRNPVSAIRRNRSALTLSILTSLVDMPGRGCCAGGSKATVEHNEFRV